MENTLQWSINNRIAPINLFFKLLYSHKFKTKGENISTELIKSSTFSAGTLINIQDTDGKNLVSFAPVRKAYYFVFSSPALLTGSSFKVYSGGTVTGATVTNGLFVGGSYSGGTQKGTFTPSSKVTAVTFYRFLNSSDQTVKP